MSYAEQLVREGVHVEGAVDGGQAELHFTSSGDKDWNCIASVSNNNHEALRRVLTAAVCWLAAEESLVMPALRGDVVARPERRED